MKRMRRLTIEIVLFVVLAMMYGCEREPYTIDLTQGSASYTPLCHQINDILSTNWDGDEINMFVTDNKLDIEFKCASGGILTIEAQDCFILLYTESSITINGSSFVNGHITPRRVGSTYLHIYNTQIDTVMKINILPEFYTYTEPGLDFDDTEDSVRAKLLKTFSLYAYNPDEHYYQVEDSRCRYNLYVNYANNGTVDNYIVDLYQGVSSDELVGYVGERYYRTTAYSNGLPVYIKAFNVSYPSISDASMIVIPNVTAQRVTYQNPLTYSN